MQSSIHTARWIALAADLGYRLHIFPIDQWPANPNLRGVTLHRPELPPEKTVALTERPAVPPEHRWRARAARFARMAQYHPADAARLLAARAWLRMGNMARRAKRLTIDAPHYLVGALWFATSEPARPKKGADISVDDARCIPLPRLEERPYLVSATTLGPPEQIVGDQIRLGESANVSPALYGPWVLASLIRDLKPTLIHSMEFQHAGYLVLKTKEIYGPGFPPWLATNWGSDIFYFRRFDDHAAQLRRLLSGIDYYSCECRRDVGLARELGYRGPVLPILPNSGGFNLNHVCSLREPGPTSRRKVIMVKGYHHFAGRAMTSIKVLETFADRLRNFEIVLFSVSSEPRQAALRLAASKKLKIRIIDVATHDEILSFFGRARLYLGISISDAISTSSLEAMAMGAFPIQTNTSCCDEWFEDGEGGFIIPPDDFETICDRFGRALSDDALVDRAADVNWKTVEARLDFRVLQGEVGRFYRMIFDGSLIAAHAASAGESG